MADKTKPCSCILESKTGNGIKSCSHCNGTGVVTIYELRDTDGSWSRFYLDREESVALAKWVIQHIEICTGFKDFVIARSSASGIGANTIIRCASCDQVADVTNYDSW